MKLAIPKERRDHEHRVAATPDTVKKLISLGFEVAVEKDAGLMSSIPDGDYAAAGATICADVEATYKDAEVIFKVQRPMQASEGDIDEMSLIKAGTLLIGILSPLSNNGSVDVYAKGNITAFGIDIYRTMDR